MGLLDGRMRATQESCNMFSTASIISDSRAHKKSSLGTDNIGDAANKTKLTTTPEQMSSVLSLIFS